MNQISKELELHLPLPSDLSWALKSVEKHAEGIIDQFYRQAEREYITELQLEILGAGIRQNLKPLMLTEKIWGNVKSFSTFAAEGKLASNSEEVIKYNIYCDYHLLLCLKSIKLLTNYNDVDLLYEGVVHIQENLYNDGKYELCENLCEKMEDMLRKDKNIDLNKLCISDLS